MTAVEVVELEVCTSTQDEVLERLATAPAGRIVAVLARSQSAGRGREGRGWQDPPGPTLLLSVGLQGPAPLRVLDDLPGRVGRALLAALAAGDALVWKAPNDLVSAADGAKVAGILVDARTTGDQVDHVVVGVGCNVGGTAFITGDGRPATTLEALTGRPADIDRLRGVVLAALTRELRRATSV